MVDKTLIFRKLTELEAYIGQISEFKSISVQDYRSEWKTQRIVERTLHLMIELCLDVGGHIISDNKFRVPDSYADEFRVLHENGIVSDTLMTALVNMAKFRNIIVHQYENVDPEIVISILRNNISDFQRFSNEIAAYLKHRP